MRPIALLFLAILLAPSRVEGLVPSGVEGPGPQENRPKPPSDLIADFQHALGKPVHADWQPYVLEMTNRAGRDIDARIHIEDEASRTVVTRREMIAGGARKRLFFYLPSGMRGAYGYVFQPRLRITDASGKPVAGGMATQAWRGSDWNAYQVGIFSGDKASDRSFGLPSQVNRVQLEVARLTPANFPDRWIGLASLDALVVHDAPLGELMPDQARALADYVRLGGTLILSPGATKGWFAHPAISGFVKILEGPPETRTELPQLNSRYGRFRQKEPFLFHPIENGVEELLLDCGREAVHFASGFGRAIVFPFDIRRGPLDGWPGLEGMWDALLSRLPRRFQERGSGLMPGSTPESRLGFFRAMSSLVNPYPSFLLLVALAALFLVIVGPVNYVMLRRLGMSLLIVVTVPAISLAFLGLTLGIGYILKGTSTVVYTVRFLWSRPGLECARETQMFSVFSPSTRTYDVLLGPANYGLPLERLGRGEDERYTRSARESQDLLECEDAGAFTFKGVGVGQWQSWNLEAQAIRDLGKGIRFEAEGGTLKIENLCPTAIVRGLYIEAGRGGFASPFGEVAAGKAVEVPLDRNRYAPLQDLGFAPESFAGRLLTPYFSELRNLYLNRQIPLDRQHKFLLCLLPEDASTVRVNARASGASRALTLLQVMEAKP